MAEKKSAAEKRQKALPAPVIKVAMVLFEAELEAFELPAFRAAVASRAGFEHNLFHNHLSDGSLRQRYPLIQYKVWKGKPVLYCLQEGIDASRHFFIKPDWTIFIGDREIKLTLAEMSIKQYEFSLLPGSLSYSIRNWIPFGSENFRKFKNASLPEQLEMLKGTLTGNILTMARGMGWEVPGKVEVAVIQISNVKKVPFKGIPHLAFDLEFEANVFLPKHIGLGRKVAVGYGMVLPAGKKENVGSHAS